MAARIALGLIILGSLLDGIFISRAQNQKGQPPEPERLIESIQGPALYKPYCAECHGADGKAGPMAKSLKVPPADLTRIARRNGGKFPLARVEKIISGEEQILAGHGGRVPDHGRQLRRVGLVVAEGHLRQGPAGQGLPDHPVLPPVRDSAVRPRTRPARRRTGRSGCDRSSPGPTPATPAWRRRRRARSEIPPSAADAAPRSATGSRADRRRGRLPSRPRDRPVEVP